MSRRTAVLFAFLAVAWGIPYLLIKVVVQEWDPSMLVFARTAGGALALLPIALARRETRAVLRHWRPVLAYAALEIGIPWFFLGSAEQHLPSSTTGLLLAAVPLAGVGVGLLLRAKQRLSALNLVGLLVGLCGVALLVGLDLRVSNTQSLVELVVVVAGYAAGPAVLARWLPDVSGVAVTAFSLAVVAIGYAPIVTLRNAWPTRVPSVSLVVSILLLIVVCSAGAFVTLAALVKAVGAVRATTVTYVNPAIALIAGAVVLHEPIGTASVGGFVVIVAGCVIAALPPRRADVTSDGVPGRKARSGDGYRGHEVRHGVDQRG